MTDAPPITKTAAARTHRASAAEALGLAVRCFTAAQFAAPLSLSERAIRKRLGKSTHTLVVRGQKTSAWPIDALPAEWQERLATVATADGFRSVEAMLTNGNNRQRWTPQEENPDLLEVAPAFLAEAQRRRDVYAPALQREREEPAPSRAEVLAIVRARHKSVFTTTVNDSRHDYLLALARDRDRGFCDFARADLYLDAAAFRTASPPASAIARLSSHAPLLSVLEELSSRVQPDADDVAYLFDRSFRHLEGLYAIEPTRTAQLAIKRSLIDWLAGVFPYPILSKTPEGLRRAFDRDLSRWIDSGRDPESLLPLHHNSGRPAHFCKPCLAKVNERARLLRGQGRMGNTSLAYRQLRTGGKLCPACCGHYKFNVAKNKSHVPKAIRIVAAPNALELANDRGQRHMEAVGPKMVGDHDGYNAGDYYVADDETSNHVVHTRVNGELVIGRLQILHLMDLKTMYPLDFITYFGPPLATMNRKLLHKVCVDGVGLPRLGFLFEKGVYAARLLIGEKGRATHNPWSFTASGLQRHYGLSVGELSDEARRLHDEGREMGIAEPGLDLHVRQATRPWSKPIEGCFHIFQKMMSGLRGFVGFNEREEIPDDLKGFEKRCREDKEDPNEKFPSLDEWVAYYRGVLDEFRHEPQPKSRRLKGASPFQAWGDYVNTHSLKKLPEDMTYLLATHKKPVSLKADGIVMEINGQRHPFANGKLGEWYGRGVRQVLAFYNIEFPHLLHVSDMKRREFITLRQNVAPAMTAYRTAEGRTALATGQKNKRDFMANATQRFSGINHPLINTITHDNAHTEESKALGRHINAVTATERADAAAGISTAPVGNRLAQAHGIYASADASEPTRQVVISDAEKAAWERLKAKRKPPTPSTTP